MLSNYLNKFNQQNPLNPSNAPKAVQDVYGNMQAPDVNYSPPTGANRDAATFWYNYEGYPDQYAMNKVSFESSGDPNAHPKKGNAAGLAQVTPQTAEAVGFNFFKQNPDKPNDPNARVLDLEAWNAAMADPNFSSMVGSMVSRKYFNQAGGAPFRAEAGYRNGFGALNDAESAGKPWPNPGYVKKMFPGQWNGQ